LLTIFLAAAALVQMAAAGDSDVGADMRCLTVSAHMGGDGQAEIQQSRVYMTQLFLWRIADRRLGAGAHDAGAAIAASDMEGESKFCMLKFLDANDDLNAMARQANAMR
jgi:hypothetical protein